MTLSDSYLSMHPSELERHFQVDGPERYLPMSGPAGNSAPQS
jgi:hypothetical protein